MTLKVFILPLLKPALLQPLCMVPALHITQITLLQHLSSALLLTQRPMLHYISASSRCDLLLDTWSAPGYLGVAGKSRMTAHSVPSLAETCVLGVASGRSVAAALCSMHKWWQTTALGRRHAESLNCLPMLTGAQLPWRVGLCHQRPAHLQVSLQLHTVPTYLPTHSTCWWMRSDPYPLTKSRLAACWRHELFMWQSPFSSSAACNIAAFDGSVCSKRLHILVVS